MKLQIKKGEVKVLDETELQESSKDYIYLDGYLYNKVVKKIWELQLKDFDAPFLIDGEVGTGKSTLGFALATILSKGNFGLRNIVLSHNDIMNKIEDFAPGEVIFVDEGSLYFNSRETMTAVSIKLQKLLDVCRFRKLILIICAPSFFNLSSYLSVYRTKFLLHVYLDEKNNRGRFAFFGKEKKRRLYYSGKKANNTYCTTSNFCGRFTKFIPSWYEEYMKLKMQILKGVSKYNTSDLSKQQKIMMLKKLIESKTPLTNEQKSAILGVSIREIQHYAKEIRENEG